MATQEKVDVVVVGAGPSGSIFADVLARAGKKVAILEFGPDWDYKEFVSSEIWGKRLKHAPRFQLAGRHNPGHGSNAGWGTGGAMIHFFANFPRLHPSDFRVKSQYGKGLDWPISYDDLSPYYDRIAEDIGALGIRVEKPAEIGPALQQALKADRPVVIDVVSDIDALAPVGVRELDMPATADRVWRAIQDAKTN